MPQRRLATYGCLGDLPLHPVDSLALLGSGIRAVILEPAGPNNQNQTLQPRDALFHPRLFDRTFTRRAYLFVVIGLDGYFFSFQII